MTQLEAIGLAAESADEGGRPLLLMAAADAALEAGDEKLAAGLLAVLKLGAWPFHSRNKAGHPVRWTDKILMGQAYWKSKTHGLPHRIYGRLKGGELSHYIRYYKDIWGALLDLAHALTEG